jgi:hypothetical protein
VQHRQPPISPRRSSSLQAGPSQGQARISMINIGTSNRASYLPPPAPPPTTSLPPIPSGPSHSQRQSNIQTQRQEGHRRQTSLSSSISSSGSHTRSRPRRISSKSSGPSSPTLSYDSHSGQPQISPRSSSLLSPVYAGARPSTRQTYEPIASTSTSTAGHTPAARTSQPADVRESRPPKPARTPSRSLLQSALDLAQKAVEMDRGNDVEGALAAYHEAVARLRLVMERVGTQPPRPGSQAESAAKAEQEGRTLRGIVSQLLCMMMMANG